MNASSGAPATLPASAFAMSGRSWMSRLMGALRAVLEAVAGWLAMSESTKAGESPGAGGEGDGDGAGKELGWGPMPGLSAAPPGEPAPADPAEGWGPVSTAG